MSRLLLLLVTAALVTTGCFAGSTSASDAPSRLRVALPFPPAQALSPWSDDALLLTRLGIAEPLVQLDAQGAAAPGLAESWMKQDDTTWRVHLRNGVKFHDGTTLTAQNAADALTKAAAAKPVPRAVKGVGLTAKADGERDVLVTTSKPDPVLPQRLSSPNLVVLAPSAYKADRVDPAGAGTGPFVLESLQGKDTASLKAFPEYWAGAPAASGVDVRFVPDGTARAGALRAGEADVAQALPVAAAPALDRQQLLEVPLPRTVSLHLNTSRPPFADAGLRATVRAAVDPKVLAQGVYEGRADTARGIFGPASPWAQRQVNRPAATTAASGQKIVLATYTDRAELAEVATVVAEALKGKGFVVEQVVREYNLLEPDLLAGKFDAVISTRSYLLDTGDPFAYLASDLTCEGSYNLSRFCDPAVDAMITQGAGLADVAARHEAALNVEAAVLAKDAVVPLVHERARIGVAQGVTGVPTDSSERYLITKATHRS